MPKVVPLPEPRLSAAESVRQQLDSEISDGTLLPGDMLDEDALALRFGVSRTPVREALLQLSARGLVTIAPRAGIYVSRLSIPELMRLMEFLAELEGACAKLATRRLTTDEAAQLKRIHKASKACVDAADAAGYSHANAEFHEVLYQACRNTALMNEIAHIRRRTQIYRQTAFQSHLRMRHSREEHGRILDAMLAGDELGAYQLMIEHFSAGTRDFTEFLSNVPPSLLATEADYPGKATADREPRKAKPTSTAASKTKPARKKAA